MSTRVSLTSNGYFQATSLTNSRQKVAKDTEPCTKKDATPKDYVCVNYWYIWSLGYFIGIWRSNPCSQVLGPVLAPPCNLQRPLSLLAVRWHSVPFLVLAPHRWPGQSAPKRHSTPMVTLSFVSIQNTPNMRYYYTAYWLGSKEGDYYAEYQAGSVQSRLSAPRFCDFAGTFMVE